jgi:hypothetical protein
MGRIKLVLGLIAVMAALMVALAAPALAKDNHGHKGGGNNKGGGNDNHRVEKRVERLDDRLDRFDNRVFVDEIDVDLDDVDLEPGFGLPWWDFEVLFDDCEGPVCLID